MDALSAEARSRLRYCPDAVLQPRVAHNGDCSKDPRTAVIRRVFVAAAIAFLLSTSATAADRPPFDELGNTCADAAALVSERLRELFEQLDLGSAGLEPVREAFAAGDLTASCETLLDYYRKSTDAAARLAIPLAEGEGYRQRADELLRDEISLTGGTGRLQRTSDGYIDWESRGPRDEEQWKEHLNRHLYLESLLLTYGVAGSPEYAVKTAEIIRDWTYLNRGFEDKNAQSASRRLMSWRYAFYMLQDEGKFDQFTRILLLASVPRQAEYVVANHETYHNHGVWEMTSLVAAAAAWPEFKRAGTWFDLGVATLSEMMEEQVYADGAYKELSSKYHNEVIELLQDAETYAAAYDAERALPFAKTTALMADYSAYSMDPIGRHSLNNDGSERDFRPQLMDLAKTFDRTDWAYIATAGGSGETPNGEPSRIWPWAGHVVLRSDWGPDALWAFIDVGPWGRAHMHDDRLHLSVTANGRELLVDNGAYNYEDGDPWRDYFTSSQAHNVVLVDGKGQGPQPKEAWLPVLNGLEQSGDIVLARGRFDDGFQGLAGTATHSRAVAMVDGRYLVVVDHVETDRPRRLTALWHFYPHVTLEVTGEQVVSVDPGVGNLRISPASKLDWQVDIVRGQTEPEIQGWYSRSFGVKTPASVARFTAEIDGSATFAWVLLPAKDVVPPVGVRWRPTGDMGASLEITIDEGLPDRLVLAPVGETHAALDADQDFNGWAAYLPHGGTPSIIGGTLRGADATILAQHEPAAESYQPAWLVEYYYRTLRARARDILGYLR